MREGLKEFYDGFYSVLNDYPELSGRIMYNGIDGTIISSVTLRIGRESKYNQDGMVFHRNGSLTAEEWTSEGERHAHDLVMSIEGFIYRAVEGLEGNQ